MASKIDRIANLLVAGHTATNIAKLTGVSPSYISNLKNDPDFVIHLEALAQEKLEEANDSNFEQEIYHDKLAAAEHKIVDHIIERLPYMADNHAILALNTVGSRRDAMQKANLMGAINGAASKGGATIRMVEILIPAVAAPDIVLGKNNEVISIGARAIAPMPTAALQRMMDTEVDYEALEQL